LGNHLIGAMLAKRGILVSVMSRDEDKHWKMKRLYPGVEFHLGDIRNHNRVLDVLTIVEPTVVILASALKHIDIAEQQLDECVETNVVGVANVVRACLSHAHQQRQRRSHDLKTVLFVSTDKACSPVNVYGMCKALSERIVTQVPYKYRAQVATLLNSRGSIVPRFMELAADPKTDHFPITDVRMTRFFMTLDQSIELIFHALVFGKSGETWIPHVPAVRIADMVGYFAARCNKPVKVIGIRPGEKLDEALINAAELQRTEKRVVHATGGRTFYVISSCLDADAKPNHDLTNEYTSAQISDFSVLKPLVDKITAQPTK
jgi:UDP-N-acetylglucosamine 4,6-dehydratase